MTLAIAFSSSDSKEVSFFNSLEMILKSIATSFCPAALFFLKREEHRDCCYSIEIEYYVLLVMNQDKSIFYYCMCDVSQMR